MQSILFVCTANICRSPTAEGVLRHFLVGMGHEAEFRVSSAGTHQYHVGMPAFPTAVEVAKRRGVDLTAHIARRVTAGDFEEFDLILAMDRANIASLRTIAPTHTKRRIELLLDYGDRFHGLEVPDPYRGSTEDFEVAFRMIKDGCKGLLQLLVR